MNELICIVCPKGCHLRVADEAGLQVTGNGCPRGAEYAHTEMTHPTRVLTSVVRAAGAAHPCCPVKTSGGVPKQDIFAAMETLRSVRLQAPAPAGTVVVHDVCGSGVDWITTREI